MFAVLDQGEQGETHDPTVDVLDIGNRPDLLFEQVERPHPQPFVTIEDVANAEHYVASAHVQQTSIPVATSATESPVGIDHVDGTCHAWVEGVDGAQDLEWLVGFRPTCG